MLRRTFFAMFAVLAMAASANAGTMYAWVVIDPVTTAGAGVASIPAAGGTNLSVSSSRSGNTGTVGTFHVFAVDDTTGGGGIRSFFLKVNNATALNNRSPQAIWDDQPGFGDGTQSTAGFDSSRVQTVPSLNGSQGNSPPNGTTVPQIGGFGISAGNMGSSISGEGSFGAYGAGGTSGALTSPQWGLYSVADGLTSGVVTASGHVRNAVLLGEGTYAVGALPSIDIATALASGGTGFGVWTAANFPAAGSFTVASDTGATNGLSNTNPFIPEPATLTLVGLAVVGFGGLVGRRRS